MQQIEKSMCQSLIRQAKKQFFSIINVRDVIDNKRNWKR